ncbi:MAG: cytochrome c-type biogenesis CcmF C-terminal domain-containing protein, partial [Pseudomonadota bacterium]
NLTFVPLFLILVLLMPIGGHSSWRKTSFKHLWSALRGTVLITMIAFAVFLVFYYERAPMAALGLTFGVWVMSGTLSDLYLRARPPSSVSAQKGFLKAVRLKHLKASYFGMCLAHFSVGVVIMGVSAVSLLTVEKQMLLSVGEQESFKGGQLRLLELNEQDGPNYRADVALLEYLDQSGDRHFLTPENRTYIGGRQTVEASIKTHVFYDLYAVFAKLDEGHQINVSIYYKPLAFWLWLGGALMFVAALLSLSDQRQIRPKTNLSKT